MAEAKIPEKLGPPYSKGSGAHCCCMIGCDNTRKKLNARKTSECEEHAPLVHNDCPCIVPLVRFFMLPGTDAEARLEWIKAINRETLPRQVNVCSDHFVDGKPTKENPNPTENLGYEVINWFGTSHGQGSFWPRKS